MGVVGTSNEAARTEGTRTKEAATRSKKVAKRFDKGATTYVRTEKAVTRSKKPPTTSIRGGSIGFRGRLTKDAITGRQTRLDEPQQSQPRERAPLQWIPLRMKSQRILHNRLSASVAGPGSSLDNEIVLK